VECTPGTAACISKAELRVCDSTGHLQAPPTTCAGACQNGTCVNCIEGTTRCASSGAQQSCKGGSWQAAVDCDLVCIDDACSKNPKTVFVTSKAIMGGAMGGLAGADAFCQMLAASANVSGTYRAWLSDATGSPTTRFSEDGGPYQLVDGTEIAANWMSLTSGVLEHAIDLSELGVKPPLDGLKCNGGDAVWSDTTKQGTLKDPAASCDDWMNTGATTAAFGDPSSTTSWTDRCVDSTGQTAAPLCVAAARLLCFQQ
jgi:hypothetical protein